jgi:hypothetical protein
MVAQTQHKAHPQVGAPTQRKARPQCKCKARSQRKASPHVRNLGAATQRKTRPQDGRPNEKLICNETSTQGSTRLTDELEDG